MAQKIKTGDADVASFLNKFKEEDRHEDLLKISKIMHEASGEKAALWGQQMIGYGSYNYKTKTSEGKWLLTGFSPRKNNISIYVIAGFETETQLLQKLGKYKTGKSCLYINRLCDVDTTVLKKLIIKSIETTKSKYS